MDFARGGKPFAETAIKLVSDQNYQRTERAPVGGTVRLHRMGNAGFERLKFASLCKKGIYNMGTGACSLLSKVFALVCCIPIASLNLTCCVVSVTCSVPTLAVQPEGLLINVLARLWKIQNFVWVAAPELGSGKWIGMSQPLSYQSKREDISCSMCMLTLVLGMKGIGQLFGTRF